MKTGISARNKRTMLVLVALIAGMGMLSYAAVPFYRLFCQITGSGGRATKVAGPQGPALNREITVRFNTDVNPGLKWAFKPETPFVKVKIGQETLVSFKATNLSGKPLAGTAMYSIAPDSVGRYLDKTQCFCFNYQLIAPGKTVHFPVVFYIDPKIVKDREQDDIKTMTLSYTFFKADSPELEQALETFYNDPKSTGKAVPINR